MSVKTALQKECEAEIKMGRDRLDDNYRSETLRKLSLFDEATQSEIFSQITGKSSSTKAEVISMISKARRGRLTKIAEPINKMYMVQEKFMEDNN